MKGNVLTRLRRRRGSERPPRRSGWRRRVLAAGVVGPRCRGRLLATLSTTRLDRAAARRGAASRRSATGSASQPGKIKHVWLIILENKSFDATFTGLNNNTYLWQTLPAQGVLLKNYYGTGHFSLDNYVSMVSGQATQPDTQADCPNYDVVPGHGRHDRHAVQQPELRADRLGRRARTPRPGTNGCVYPSSVQTLFNQLDAAHVSWKGYAQDLGNPDASGPTHSVGGPQPCSTAARRTHAERSPEPTGANTAQPNPGSANATDQYVPKHFPFPWFESLLSNPSDCNSAHIANLFDPTNGLYHDLQSESTTPAFSWISPNNCSDAHDAVCQGNNLSGGWIDPNTPNPRR